MLKRFTPAFKVMLLAIPLAGCNSLTTSNTSRTATEQLLISMAAERAAANLRFPVARGSKVFIDNTYFEGTDSKYATAAIRHSALKSGLNLVNDKKAANFIVEIRAGALSTTKRKFLIGIPSITLPMPLASNSLTIPEMALYSKEDQAGVARFAFSTYDAKTGAYQKAVQGPQYGLSHNVKQTAVLFISWTDNETEPYQEDEVKQAGTALSADANGG